MNGLMNRKKPLYKIIYDDIVQKIHNETYKVGDALPSEMELENMFKASRTPVRQALKQLESDGLIYRYQGKGSFVSNFKPLGQWTTMTGFKQMYMDEWKKVSARTLSVELIKSPFYASLLEVGSNEDLVHLKRIRLFNGEPIIYLEHYLPSSFPIEMFEKDPTFISIDQLLKDEKNIEFLTINEEIEAVPADTNISNYLHANEGTSVLKSTRVSFDQNSVPTDVTVNFFRTEKWKYSIQFQKQ
ncbi:GntR family transcriptional regulator [Priestia sp. FSL R5-0597]|uniref:GntR family transcriptional regulator n=1 Tax=Priestia TaxID=2800373 RepID=UPI0015F726BE|nr:MULTISPECIES: GntR family transcriptional regulator [Priestia]MED3887836.1 GntR family transcriptional regulator [Priestia aryabhattai]MED4262066.1 GntR family transcriptional regulator [Priestia aryabhattai]